MSKPRYITNRRPMDFHAGIQPMPDPRRGTIRLSILIAALFILVLTLGSETGRAIVFGAVA